MVIKLIQALAKVKRDGEGVIVLTPTEAQELLDSFKDQHNETIDELIRRAQDNAKLHAGSLGEAQWTLIEHWLEPHKIKK